MPTGPLLAVGFHRPATGLTRVLARVLAELAPTREVHWLGIGYRGEVRAGPVTLHPANREGGDPYGAYGARALAERLRPAAVLLYNDGWLLKNYMTALGSLPGQPPLIAYLPLDGTLRGDALIAPLGAIDRFVVFTDFARGEIERSLARLGRATPVGVIGHGVDRAVFRPCAGSLEAQLAPGGRLAARRRCLPELPDPAAAFLVLNANRPQPRKRIDLTVAGFARFARDKPDSVRLVLHHAVTGERERAEIRSLARSHGVADRLVPSEGALGDEELNLLYNACDVGLNTALGEGWGLIAFEHAATGAAQVLPGHSACAELWRGAAELVPAPEVVSPPFTPLDLRAVTPEGVAAALERLYRDREHRDARARAAYRNACRARYHWGHVAGQWRQLLQEVMA